MHACKWGCKSRCGTLNGMGQHYRLVMAALEKGCPSDPLHVCQQARSKVNRMSMMTAKHDGDLHAATQSADCACVLYDAQPVVHDNVQLGCLL